MKCRAPYIGIFYRTNRDRISPCCQYQEVWDPEEYDYSIPATEIESSDTFIDKCKICSEQSGHKTTLMEKFDQYYNDYANDSGDVFAPVYADVRTSNYCNLQCNMCSPLDSSKIESFVKQHSHMTQYFKDIPNEFENQEVNVPVADLGNLRVLKVAGGEPTIDPQCLRFLDRFVEEHDTTKTELWLTTNGSRLIPFLTKYKGKFKRVCVTVSIDATEDLNTFIRYPCDWEQLIHNIEEAMSQGLADDLNINTVIQPFNIVSVADWCSWFEDFRKRFPRTKHVLLECSKPKHFSMKAMSDTAKEYALAEIAKCKETHTVMLDKLEELEKMISKAEYKKEYHQQLIQYTDDISIIRNVDYWNLNNHLHVLRD